jgi:hypothetical protein
MNADFGTGYSRLLPLAGAAYLVYLATQPPPARWVGLGCLAVLAPLFAGWLLGNVAGVGPWAPDDTE